MPVTRRRGPAKSKATANCPSDADQRITDYFAMRKNSAPPAVKRGKLAEHELEPKTNKMTTRKMTPPPPENTSDLNSELDPVQAQIRKLPSCSKTPVAVAAAASSTVEGESSTKDTSPRRRKVPRNKLILQIEQQEAAECLGSSSPITPNSAKRKLTFGARRGEPTNNDQPSVAKVGLFASSPINEIRLPSKSQSPNPFSSATQDSATNEKQTTQNLDQAKAAKPPLPKITRQKLGRVRNLKELQSQLAASSEVVSRLQASKQTYNDEVRDITRVHLSPKKSPQKTGPAAVTPEKEDSIPAHERFSHLCSPVKDVFTQLPLPPNHAVLIQLFRGLDVCVGMLQQRKEYITFEKLRPAVQTYTKRDFKQRHLAQCLFIYPEAYKCEVQKALSRYGRHARSDEYDLVVTPLFDNDLLGKRLPTSSSSQSPVKGTGSAQQIGNVRLTPVKSPLKTRTFLHSPIKTPTKYKPSLLSPFKKPRFGLQGLLHNAPGPTKQEESDAVLAESNVTRLSGSRQQYRAAILRQRLVQHVMQEHQKFLLTLNPPTQMSLTEHEQLRHWHPKFPLAQVCEVPSITMPQAPNGPVQPASVRSLMSQFQNTNMHLPQNVDRALHKLATGPQSAAVTNTNTAHTSNTKTGTATGALKGVSTSLLEKIRAKQAARELQAMSRDPEADLRALRLARLPDFVRIIRHTFVDAGKNTLAYSVLTQKLMISYSNLIREADLEAHIELLIEVVPGWLSKQTVGAKGQYVKLLQPNTPLTTLLELIDVQKKKLMK